MVVGAALGASLSALSGGNPLIGALTGAIARCLYAGAGSLAQALNLVSQSGVYASTQALIEASLLHAAAGAVSGSIGAAMTGGNVGSGALSGGISAGVACGVGGALMGTNWFSSLQPEEQFFAGLVSQAGIGAVTGGVTSEIVCGQFLHGFGQGAWTAAYGFIFNWTAHNGPAALMTDGDNGSPSFYTTISASDPAAAAMDKVFNGLALAVTVGATAYYAGPYALTFSLAQPDFVVGFLEGIAPPLSGVSTNAYGYATGVAASYFLPQGVVGP